MEAKNVNNQAVDQYLEILTAPAQQVKGLINIMRQNTPAMNVIEKATESMIKGQKSKCIHLNNNPDDNDVIRYAKQIIENNTRISPEATINLVRMMLGERSDIVTTLYKLIDATEDVLHAHSQMPAHISLEENQLRSEMNRLKAAREDAANMFPIQFLE